MAEKHRKKLVIATLSEVMISAKENIIKANLSINEVALNANINEKLLAILLDNSNDVVNGLSRFLEFARVEIRHKKSKINQLYIKRASSKDELIRIHRTINPRCSIRYNQATDEMSDFRSKNEIEPTEKQIIINEMYDFIHS